MNIPSQIENPKIIKLWNLLSSFVNETCIDREESHGHTHMHKVAFNSIDILYSCQELEIYVNDENFISDVITVAWLHDVDDHKYNDNNRFKMVKFLSDFSDAERIMSIIDKISFSKEQKAIENAIDWEKILCERDMTIRNVVSDADKLEALGLVGLKRCILFASEKNDKKLQDCYQDVLYHCIEKLFILQNYFRFENSKQKAKGLTLITEFYVKNYESYCSFLEIFF